MPANRPSPLRMNAQRTPGSGSLRSTNRARTSGLARSIPKENVHLIGKAESPRVGATQAGTSALKAKKRSAVRMRTTGGSLGPAGLQLCAQRPEGFAGSSLANSPCASKSTKTARTPLRTISNVSPASQATPAKMDAGLRLYLTPVAAKILVYPYTPTSKPTLSPRKSGLNSVGIVTSPDVFTTTTHTSSDTLLGQDIPQSSPNTSLTRSPCPSFVYCSSPKALPPTRRTSLPAPRRSSPPPASRRLSLPTRSVAPADPLPSFITIEAVILPSGLARPRRPTSIMTASSKSNKSRSGSVREGMIAASVNRLADLVSVLDNCERRIDEALGTTGIEESGCGLAGGLITTGSAFDSDSSMDSDGIRTQVGYVDDAGLLDVDSAEDKGPTFEYFWNADGDLVRKDPTTDSDVAFQESSEKERASEERLERARELVRVRMERRVAGCRDVY